MGRKDPPALLWILLHQEPPRPPPQKSTLQLSEGTLEPPSLDPPLEVPGHLDLMRWVQSLKLIKETKPYRLCNSTLLLNPEFRQFHLMNGHSLSYR
jgi:hypothetical protein